jgi:hypothetical protein
VKCRQYPHSLYRVSAWYQVEFEVMLYQLEVQLDVVGEHRVLVGGRDPTPKSKLVPAFQ